MATLKRSPRDGHYYVRGYVHAAHHPAIWQVTEQGVSWLREYGVREDQQFPNHLLSSLIRHGMAYTQGQGFPESASLAPFPFQARNGRIPLLSIMVNEDTWHLSMLFPELQSNWQPDARILSECSFHIDDALVLPAIRLWPGKGGSAIRVLPKEGQFYITSTGPWPSDWDLSAWTGTVAGLNPMGTLFSGEVGEGIRLEAGDSVSAGSPYYLIARAAELGSLRNAFTHPPATIRMVKLKPINDWEAWKLELPNVPDERTHQWCLRIHHPLAEPSWRLTLLSPPPHSYSVHKLPRIELGQKVVIASNPPEVTANQVGSVGLILEYFSPNTNTARRIGTLPVSREGQFFSFLVNEIGFWRVRAVSGQAVPLSFQTISQNRLQAPGEYPVPLNIVIQKGSEKLHLNAFREGTGPHTVVLPDQLDEISFHMVAHSPVPISLSWDPMKFDRQNTGGVYRLLDPLRQDLGVAIQENRKSFKIEVDAHNFGRLFLHLVPSVLSGMTDASFLEKTTNLAKWLELVIPSTSAQSGQILVSIPTDARKALKMLGRDYPILSDANRVPVSLLAYILALAHDLPH